MPLPTCSWGELLRDEMRETNAYNCSLCFSFPPYTLSGTQALWWGKKKSIRSGAEKTKGIGYFLSVWLLSGTQLWRGITTQSQRGCWEMRERLGRSREHSRVNRSHLFLRALHTGNWCLRVCLAVVLEMSHWQDPGESWGKGDWGTEALKERNDGVK